MKVLVFDSYEEMSAAGAEIICEQLKNKPNSVLGLATGSTPIGMYDALAEECKKGNADFSKVTSVNLDEYYPISPDNKQSYRYTMNSTLFDHINIDINKTHVLDGMTNDPDKTCKAYDEFIDSIGGIDLQVLGIGNNGHIAFNEPDEWLEVGTHKTALTESTMQANARYFSADEVMPTHALTMGIGSIMKARKIIILINGAKKTDALKKMLSGKLSTDCPASMLQLHPDVTVICDRAAYGE